MWTLWHRDAVCFLLFVSNSWPISSGYQVPEASAATTTAPTILWPGPGFVAASNSSPHAMLELICSIVLKTCLSYNHETIRILLYSRRAGLPSPRCLPDQSDFRELLSQIQSIIDLVAENQIDYSILKEVLSDLL